MNKNSYFGTGVFWYLAVAYTLFNFSHADTLEDNAGASKQIQLRASIVKSTMCNYEIENNEEVTADFGKVSYFIEQDRVRILTEGGADIPQKIVTFSVNEACGLEAALVVHKFDYDLNQLPANFNSNGENGPTLTLIATANNQNYYIPVNIFYKSTIPDIKSANKSRPEDLVHYCFDTEFKSAHALKADDDNNYSNGYVYTLDGAKQDIKDIRSMPQYQTRGILVPPLYKPRWCSTSDHYNSTVAAVTNNIDEIKNSKFTLTLVPQSPKKEWFLGADGSLPPLGSVFTGKLVITTSYL